MDCDTPLPFKHPATLLRPPQTFASLRYSLLETPIHLQLRIINAAPGVAAQVIDS